MSQTIQMPSNYMRCVAEEGKCPLRETCLRSMVHREADYKLSTGYYGLLVVNLWQENIKPLTNECRAYRKAEARQFTRGFTHIFDLVPKGVYATVQKQVEHVFSNRLYYFQCKKGTRLTSPEEQEAIAHIFQKNGITSTPRFDEMVEVYDYSE